MSFIERLEREKQEKETRERLATAEKARDERQRRETVTHPVQRGSERDMHLQRMEQAERFQKESGLYDLMETVAGLISGEQSGRFFRYPNPENAVGELRWDHKREDKKTTNKFLWAETFPDGTIIFHGGMFGSSSISRSKWLADKSAITNALEKAYKHPIKESWHDKTTTWDSFYSMYGYGQCLSKNTLITTPSGFRKIQHIKVGDPVWTINKTGKKIISKIIRTIKVAVGSNYRILDIVLEDGRRLLVSPAHPNINGRALSESIKGSYLDRSRVVSVRSIHYKSMNTYDILPGGQTGGYWANGVLIGSTIPNNYSKEKFSKTYRFLTNSVYYLLL